MNKVSVKQKIILIIFGLFLCAVLLEIGLRIGGFVFLSLQEYRNRISIKQRGTYRIMCLGGSTTALGGKDSYPSQFEEVLNQQDIRIKFSVINKGVDGIDSAGIVSQLGDNLDKYTPDMVITMMGINDNVYWNNTIAYKNIPIKRIIPFFKSFRTYKLAELLWLHTINKTHLVQPANREEKRYKEAIEIDPENEWLYIALGDYYKRQGRHKEAEEMYQGAIEVNADNDELYIKLGWYYREQGEYNKAKEMLKKAIEINPGNDWVYVELGWHYKDHYKNEEDCDKAKEMFKKAIEINSENSAPYIGLGWCYRNQGKHDRAEEMFRKAIEIDPENGTSYFNLGWWYRDQGRYEEAEELLKRAIEINPENDNLCSILALLYEKEGKDDLAGEYRKRVNRLRLGTYNPITRYNYQRLKEMVTQRGIRLVCMQYPMRSIKPLKKMLKPHDSIIFVDNERVFKEVLEQAIYEEYFMDSFAGDFGHCTRKGNRLLAENITDIILKEHFNINK